MAGRHKCPYCTYSAMTPGSLEGHISMLVGKLGHPGLVDAGPPAEPVLTAMPHLTVVSHDTSGLPPAPVEPARKPRVRIVKSSDPTFPIEPLPGQIEAFPDEPTAIAGPEPLQSPVLLPAVTAPKYPTREAWMLAAVEAIRPWFAEHGEIIPPVRISIGWPGGRGSKKGVLGQCWAAAAVDDQVPAIFVTPTQREAVEVLETIAHECIHAAGHFHHRADFQKVALALGFENGGKHKTDRDESPALYHRLDKLAAELGTFPHAAVKGETGLLGTGPKAPPVQSTRMLKVWCEEDGYTLRATAKWLNEAVPSCPLCEGLMQVEWKDGRP